MEEMTVTQVAKLLGKTDRTIRNYIKDGRIKARRIDNQFGWEYRVYDLGELAKSQNGAETDRESTPETQAENKSETPLQIVTLENQRLWEEFKQLREVNNRLAYDLGMRDQRIKELELMLEQTRNLLTVSPTPNDEILSNASPSNPAKKPWWKKIFGG